jgi:hypothetical protein
MKSIFIPSVPPEYSFKEGTLLLLRPFLLVGKTSR